MELITADQSQTVTSILNQNVSWVNIDFSRSRLQENVIENSTEAGRHFTMFLQNGGRIDSGSKIIWIDPKKQFDPTSSIGRDWAFWKGPISGDGLSGARDWDPRSSALTEVSASQIALLTCLRERESRIGGEEKLSRLKAVGQIRLGASVFFAFWLDYEKNKEDSILEGLRKSRNITYLDFFGDILRGPGGYRYVLCLSWCVDAWRWDYCWLGGAWSAGVPSAVLAS